MYRSLLERVRLGDRLEIDSSRAIPEYKHFIPPRSFAPYFLLLFPSLLLSFDTWIEPPCISNVLLFLADFYKTRREQRGVEAAAKGAEKSATTLTKRQEWKDKGEINPRIVTIGKVLARTSGMGPRGEEGRKKEGRRKEKGRRRNERAIRDGRGSREKILSVSVDVEGKNIMVAGARRGIYLPSMDIE